MWATPYYKAPVGNFGDLATQTIVLKGVTENTGFLSTFNGIGVIGKESGFMFLTHKEHNRPALILRITHSQIELIH
ncbi:MAG: hypothetical protein DWQ07_13565 [Chloroflexi bacterium]|nr:MAG: hypothetical protein DWQ07_13565 [Chloroflexota bacterium]